MPLVSSHTVQVHVAAINPDTNSVRFLLLQRSKKSKQYPNMWQVITGKLKPGETALETALRETYEEISVYPKMLWTIPFVSVFFETKRDLMHLSPVFGVVIDYNTKIKLSEEHQDYQWLRYEDAIHVLTLPTHKEGTKRFYDYVLSRENKNLFRLNLDKKVKAVIIKKVKAESIKPKIKKKTKIIK